MRQILIAVCALGSFAALAQAPEGRSTKTIVADVLAQMPARDGSRLDELMADLSTTGAEGVAQLVGMLPGARAEYALDGLADWVSVSGREQAKATFVDALSGVAVSDAESKALLVELMQLNGSSEPAAATEMTSTLAPNVGRVAKLAAKMKPENATELLVRALKDDDRRYRYAALELASKYADEAMYARLTERLEREKPAVQTDVLNWLAEECDIPARRTLIARVAGATIEPLHRGEREGDTELVKAAAGLLAETGGSEAIAALTPLLENPETVAIGGAALTSVGGDIAMPVARLVPSLGDAGKVVALGLLAERGAVRHADVVLAELDSNDPEVQSAAYAAYATLAAIEQDFPAVFERMNAAPADEQYRYYPALAATADDRALTLLIDRFDAETGPAQDAAFDALVNWNGIAAAEKLMTIAAIDPARADRAFGRYVDLATEPRLIDALAAATSDNQRNAILRRLASTDSYRAMVAAGKYLDNPATSQAASQAVMKIALGNPSFAAPEVRALLEKVITTLDNPDAGYEQQAIRKHLAEMQDLRSFELSEEERAEGFTVLFGGTDLDAWTGNKTDYRVENGTIALYPSLSFGGNLYTAKEYGNFVYRFEFMLTPGANNGVGIRTPKDVDAAYHGMEIQILDHDDAAYRDITTHQVHGSVYGVIGAKRAKLRPAGEWNTEEIVADGDHIRVTLNGEVILDGNIREASQNGTFDGLKHPGLFNKKGHIGFLGHGSELKFRNIRIRELK